MGEVSPSCLRARGTIKRQDLLGWVSQLGVDVEVGLRDGQHGQSLQEALAFADTQRNERELLQRAVPTQTGRIWSLTGRSMPVLSLAS